MFFVECKWIVKEKKTSRIINEDLGTYSDDFDEEISSDDFDEETSNESSCESDLWISSTWWKSFWQRIDLLIQYNLVKKWIPPSNQ